MTWLVFALGGVMAGAGLTSILSGAGYMQFEWGWTEVIAGTCLMSGGGIVLAIGVLVGQVTRLRQSFERAARASSLPSVMPAPRSVRAPEAVAERLGRPESPDPAGSDPGAPDSAIPEVVLGDWAAAEPAFPENAEPVRGWDDGADTHSAAEFRGGDGAAPPREAEPEPLTIVGRYHASGANYVLFSDGTIEVETETGSHRFASMHELKSFIESA